MHRWIVTLTVAALAVGLVTAPRSVAAASGPPPLEDTIPVAPGLVREIRSWSTTGGQQHIEILRFSLDDERVSFRPELARGVVPGREPVHDTLIRLGDEAVAGVNGGFWLSTPDGDPEGMVIQDGRYLSEPATQGAGPRAAFALFPDGSWEVGRPDHRADVWFPSGRSARLFGINRLTPDDGVVAYTRAWGASTPHGDAVEAVFDLELRPNTLASHVVREVRRGGGPLRTGQVVLSGRGSWAVEVGSLEAGDLVTFDLRSSEPWDGARQALAAGPLLIQDGKRVPRDQWVVEGFGHEVHNDRAHPRTAVGFTAEGEMLLVTVDGRSSGRVGLTTDETISMLLSLGAVDAVMMDGGGSTTMAVDGRITNRPCCDSAGYRSVATSLVVRSTVDTPAVDRLAGADRYATAAAIAQRGWAGGTQRAFLASGLTYPDGLAGGPLAAASDAPLLLTDPNTLPKPTRTALTALGVREVTVLGGPVAVSDAVLAELAAMNISATRIAGTDRASTAADVARQLPRRSDLAIVASGRGFADALAAVVPAHVAGAPLLLTEPDALPESTLSVLREREVSRVVLAGGPSAVSENVRSALEAAGFTVERVAGPDRYRTAVALVEWAERVAGLQPTQVAVASGDGFPDALAGGTYAARIGAPVLLSTHTSLARTGPPAQWLQGHVIDRATIFGGRRVLSTWTAHELQAATLRS